MESPKLWGSRPKSGGNESWAAGPCDLACPQVHSDDPQGPGLSRARAASLGLAFASAWKTGDWAAEAVLPRHFQGHDPKKWPRRLSRRKAWATTQTGRGRASRSPRAPRPIPATWPDPARGNWVGREATDGRRLQRDCEPVSRNLSKWTGQAGLLRAGVIEAAAPTPARPGTAGEPGRPLNGAGWRQGSGRRGSGREAGDGSSSVYSPSPSSYTHRPRRGWTRAVAPPLLVTGIGPHTGTSSPGTLINHRALSASLTAAPRYPDARPLCHTTTHTKPSLHVGARRSTPSHTDQDTGRGPIPGRSQQCPLTPREVTGGPRTDSGPARPPPPDFRVAGSTELIERVQRAGGPRPTPARRPGPGRPGRGRGG